MDVCNGCGFWTGQTHGLSIHKIVEALKPISPENYLRLSHFAKLKRLAEKPDPYEQPLFFRCDTSEADEEGEGVVVEFDRPAS